MKYERIKENLDKIIRAIDPIGDSNLRRFIDAQIVIIHRKAKGIETDSIEKEADRYWKILQE